MLENEGATPDEVTSVVPEADAPLEKDTPVSMDDTIRDTLRSIKSRDPESVELTDKTPDTPEQKAEKIRDRAGKFAKPDDSLVTDLAPKAAPNTWRKEQAAKFNTLPPDIQEEVLRREADIHRGLEQYRDKAQFGEAMEKAVTPFLNTIQNQGLTPDKAVAELMQADHKLRYGSPAEKTQFLAYLAQSYGIDVTNLPTAQQTQLDPNIAHLQQQVQQLSGYIQNQQFEGQKREEQSLNSEIESFKSDPKNRHFESVRHEMAGLLQAGLAANLQDAYERAIYANPTTRAQVIAEQQAQARAQATQTAQAARNAASVNVRRRPSLPTRQPIGTMDDTIRQTLRRLTA